MEKNDFLDEKGYLAESKRIILRALRKDECMRYWELDSGAEQFDDGFRDLYWQVIEEKDDLVLTIADRLADSFFGYLSLQHIKNEVPEIGISVVREKRKMGYATESVKLMTETLKAKFGISEFLVRIYSDNIASKRLFSKFNIEPNGEGKSFVTTALEVLKEAYPELEFKQLQELEENDKKAGRYIEKYKLYV